jgi:dolichol-phosphate mannosyltransferase
MKLSVLIPAHNEAESLPATIRAFYQSLIEHNIDHEILVVNDNSADNTLTALNSLQKEINTLRIVSNTGANGFGNAVRFGLRNFSGGCVALVMADLSDSPDDLLKFYTTMVTGNYDCVFGSRFIKGGKTINYPFIKLVINRVANNLVKIVFRINYNDCTNAFKLYKRETIEGLQPLLSPHFNLTLEMSLKAIVRGYTYAVVPNTWINRKHGVSKLKIKEMGSRYFFIFLYCLIEKFFSRGDFKKRNEV